MEHTPCEHAYRSVLPNADGVLEARCATCGDLLNSEAESSQADVLALVPSFTAHETRHPEVNSSDEIAGTRYVLDRYGSQHLFCLACRTLVQPPQVTPHDD